MPVDTREKRQSALSFLVPTFVPGVEPDSPAVEEPERQAGYWSYAGILAEYPVPPMPLCGSVAIRPLVLATLQVQPLLAATMTIQPLLLATATSAICEEVGV